jgi:acyl carrier protein
MGEDGMIGPITEDSRLEDDLNITSLKMISLITDLCDELNIDIYTLSDVDLAKMKRVADITAIFEAKRASDHLI